MRKTVMAKWDWEDNDFAIGCDGAQCKDASMQVAYPIELTESEYPQRLCRSCWNAEMRQRRQTKLGAVLPFPGDVNEDEGHNLTGFTERIPRKNKQWM